ncbi:MAG: hypothetical protein K0S25_20 [Bacillus sp. (in: firmicutes)]|jgi:hypothetical protein|nr:hypothetical protein [Bacillus sp. (in: firmicutes)]
MKIADVIPRKQKQQLEKMKSPKKKHKKKPKPPKKEVLSQKDIEDLMGIHRDTYKRNNGAIRRK